MKQAIKNILGILFIHLVIYGIIGWISYSHTTHFFDYIKSFGKGELWFIGVVIFLSISFFFLRWCFSPSDSKIPKNNIPASDFEEVYNKICTEFRSSNGHLPSYSRMCKVCNIQEYESSY